MEGDELTIGCEVCESSGISGRALATRGILESMLFEYWSSVANLLRWLVFVAKGGFGTADVVSLVICPALDELADGCWGIILPPRYAGLALPLSLIGVRVKGFRATDDACSLFWSKRLDRSLTLGFWGPEEPFNAAVDFAVLSAILSSIGTETDRFGGLKAFREAVKEGCFGVVPLPFDRSDEGGSRDTVVVGAAVIMPFVLTSL
jgi:hypothetical protein